MIRLIAAAVLGLALAACQQAPAPSAAPNTLTAAERSAGWKLLFNGKDLSGWHIYRGGPAAAPWAVEDGAITVTAKGPDIISAAEFADFEMSYEWKIAPKGNSGLMFFVVESEQASQTYQTGPEMQVIDNDGHPDGKFPNHRAGSLYDLVTPPEGVAKPVGEWNVSRLKVSKGHITQWLNGKVTAESPYGDDAWRKMVAGSKFKSMPLFGLAKSGHIALQDHDGDRVWFRSLKIRSL